VTGSSLDAANHVGQPAQVVIKEIPIGNTPDVMSAAPISVSIYQFPMAQAAQRRLSGEAPIPLAGGMH
jgi:hypothetical protein